MVIKFNGITKNYRQLSLNYPRKFTCKGKEYENIYHYLMACKYLRVIHKGIDIESEVYAISDSKDLRIYTNSLTCKPSAIWEESKYKYLLEAVRVKAYGDVEFKDHLLSTGDAILEYITPMDNEWGTGVNSQGENLLGRALMDVRKELQDK